MFYFSTLPTRSRPNANGGGVTPKEMLQNISNGQSATTATQKISDTATSVKNLSSVAAQGISRTASNIKDTVQELSRKVKK